MRGLIRRGVPLRAIQLPAELAELRAEVRAFLDEELRTGGFVPRVDGWQVDWDPEFSRRLAARGWVGMAIPREYGGGGRSALDRYVVVEELVAAGAPVAAHWIADRQTAPSLLRYGTPEQRELLLPAIARAECFTAIGMSEPGAGSDLASVRTRAVRVDGGWRVSGTKTWTSGAHRAHYFFVLARSAPVADDRHHGLSQFIVDLRTPGITVRPIRLLTGAHHFNEVLLEDVFVPDSMVFGEIGQGWRQVVGELAFERSGPERFLSPMPLLSLVAAGDGAGDDLGDRDPGDDDRGDGDGFAGGLGAGDGPGRDADGGGVLAARLWVLRQLSLAVAGELAAGRAPGVEAAMSKDLGTEFETAAAGFARTVTTAVPDLDAPPDSVPGQLARAILHSPNFTLRGGTTEALRSIVAKGLESW